jgi:hypothetical protein
LFGYAKIASVRSFLALVCVCILFVPVRANTGFTHDLANKLNSFEIRIEELEKLASNKRERAKFQRKARTLFILQKIMFSRWQQNYQEELTPANDDELLARLKENNEILANAVQDFDVLTYQK